MSLYFYSEKLFIDSLTNEQKLCLKYHLEKEVCINPRTNCKSLYNIIRKELKNIKEEEMINLKIETRNKFARKGWEL